MENEKVCVKTTLKSEETLIYGKVFLSRFFLTLIDLSQSTEKHIWQSATEKKIAAIPTFLFVVSDRKVLNIEEH